MDRVAQVARAVLYEGYVLWPYRRSAPKNRGRWTFGGIFPPAWSAEHPDDRDALRCDVLIEGAESAPAVTASVRCLQAVARQPFDAEGRPVDTLEAGGERHLSFEEATERELPVAVPGRETPFSFPAGAEEEPVAGGSVRRGWDAIEGAVAATLEPAGPGRWRATLELRNTTPGAAADRAAALRGALLSAHVVLRTADGAFVPGSEAAACRNEGVWPILVGEEGDRSTMLCSPIILEDHPRIAPESPGDMFDGGEIDQLLVLNILALTDEERAEMRDTDPRTRAILERCAAMDRDDLMRLHGTIREFGPA